MNSNNSKIKQTKLEYYIENIQIFMYVHIFLTFTLDFLFLYQSRISNKAGILVPKTIYDTHKLLLGLIKLTRIIIDPNFPYE
jgi:hypothetical protein